MSTPADRVVKQGDTITFTMSTAHSLRFGGSIDDGATGKPVPLTPVEKIKTLLQFKPDIPAGGEFEAGATITTTVLATAAPGEEFRFACGIHLGDMLSEPLKIEAAGAASQSFAIRAAGGFKWLLKKPDGVEVQIDTTP
jgi:hypothetical protein